MASLFRLRGRGFGGWLCPRGAEEEGSDAQEDDDGGEGELAGEVGAGEEDVGEAGEREEGREGVEPEAEGAGEIGLGAAEEHDADVLGDELQKEAERRPWRR